MRQVKRFSTSMALVAAFAMIALGASRSLGQGTWDPATLQIVDDGTITGVPGTVIQFHPEDFADQLWQDGTYTPANTNPVFPPAYVPVADGDGWTPQRGLPGTWFENPYDALGAPDRSAPDFNNNNNPKALSLGKNWYHRSLSGSVTVRFDSASQLRADGTSMPDLWIFEAGEDNEGVIVEISQDGSTWYEVGNLPGSSPYTPVSTFLSTGGPNDYLAVMMAAGSGIVDTHIFGIDIDDLTHWSTAFPAPLEGELFPYIRVYDNPDPSTGDSNKSYGADIDAIGVLYWSTDTAVPEPTALTLLGTGGLVLGLWWRWRRK